VKEQVHGCDHPEDRKTRGWKMNTCVTSNNVNLVTENVRYSCTRPSTGGPWTLHATTYSSEDFTCSGTSTGTESIDNFNVGDGTCTDGTTYSCVTDPHPPETQSVEAIRTEWYLAVADCNVKSNAFYFETQSGCARTYYGSTFASFSGYEQHNNQNCDGSPMYIIPYQLTDPCTDSNSYPYYNYPSNFELLKPKNYLIVTQTAPKPPSSCPLDLHSLTTSVRLSRQKWVTDAPPASTPPPASRRSLASADSTTSSALDASAVTTTDVVAAPSSTHVCDYFDVKYRNLLSIRSVVQSASDYCLNIVLTLDTKKDHFDPTNKFVRMVISDDYNIYERKRLLFEDNELVTVLTPYTPGLQTFKVQLQLDFMIEKVRYPMFSTSTDYYVEVTIIHEDQDTKELDCVAVHL